MHGGARQGAGRKPAEDPRKPVTIRMTEAEITALKKAAEEAGKTTSQYMRDKIFG